MRNVSVAGQFSRRPRLIGSFFGDFGAPGEAGQRWQPPVPFEQSTGSRDRTPASGGVRFVPRRPAPSTGTGLGASARFSPRHGAAFAGAPHDLQNPATGWRRSVPGLFSRHVATAQG